MTTTTAYGPGWLDFNAPCYLSGGVGTARAGDIIALAVAGTITPDGDATNARGGTYPVGRVVYVSPESYARYQADGTLAALTAKGWQVKPYAVEVVR